jgi:hypothetical protein
MVTQGSQTGPGMLRVLPVIVFFDSSPEGLSMLIVLGIKMPDTIIDAM